MNKALLSIIALFATIMVTNSFCMENHDKQQDETTIKEKNRQEIILAGQIIGKNIVRKNLTTELEQEKQNIKKLKEENDKKRNNLKEPSLLCYRLTTYSPYLNHLGSCGLYVLAKAYLPATDKKEIIASTLSLLGSIGIQKLCDWFFVSKVREYAEKFQDYEKRKNWYDGRLNKVEQILKSKNLELETEPNIGEE